MTVFSAMLLLQRLRRSRARRGRCTGTVLRAPGPHTEQHVLLGWSAGYALVALATGAVGMAGVADGLSLHPFLPLLALSALTLAASLLFAIAALLACMATLPELGARGPGARFR